jgi:hypothetical protein
MGKSVRARFLAGLMTGVMISAHAAGVDTAPAETERAVVELFTSQGCSSCPPADAIAGRLQADPSVVVLSFHVNYWDDLGWKDPFSSQPSTDRQKEYAGSLGVRSVFTPQLVVNGSLSLVGSREDALQRALADTRRAAFPAQAEITAQPDGSLVLNLTGAAAGAKVWEVRYVRHSVTQIRAGENKGRALDTYNDVTHIGSLGNFAPGALTLPPLKAPDDGIAVIIQARGMGRIFGATAWHSQ